MQLPDSVVIVTGAASGIGRATVAALGQHGSRVIAVDRDGEGLGKVAADTGALGIEVDVADPAHADTVVRKTIAEFGRIDAVVANAGIGYVGEFAEMPVELISTLLHVNLRAPMLLIRAALPHLQAQPGKAAVVITTSIGGAVPVPTEAAYGVSKTALESFADALREELRPAGITVTAIRPGVVETAFHASRNEPYERKFPRPVSPEKIADVITEALQTGAEHRTVPRWLDIAVRAHHASPRLYAALARRFG